MAQSNPISIGLTYVVSVKTQSHTTLASEPKAPLPRLSSIPKVPSVEYPKYPQHFIHPKYFLCQNYHPYQEYINPESN